MFTVCEIIIVEWEWLPKEYHGVRFKGYLALEDSLIMHTYTHSSCEPCQLICYSQLEFFPSYL